MPHTSLTLGSAMVRNAFMMFLGLVGIYFIAQHPDKVVELIQIVLQAAENIADAFAHALK